MKTTSILLLTSLLATSFLSADRIIKAKNPVAAAVVVGNNSNPNNSAANKAVKVGVARNVIDPNDSAAEKVVKGKVIQGDQRKKRQIQRNVR